MLHCHRCCPILSSSKVNLTAVLRMSRYQYHMLCPWLFRACCARWPDCNCTRRSCSHTLSFARLHATANQGSISGHKVLAYSLTQPLDAVLPHRLANPTISDQKKFWCSQHREKKKFWGAACLLRRSRRTPPQKAVLHTKEPKKHGAHRLSTKKQINPSNRLIHWALLKQSQASLHAEWSFIEQQENQNAAGSF